MKNQAIMRLMLLVGLGVSLPAQSALIDRGDGLIYDDVLDITWLQDASMGGNRNWAGAVSWADGLEVEGFEDWRLPSMDVDGDGRVVLCSEASELECRDNELGYMYDHNLGGSGNDLTGDQGLIDNIQAIHWSGTDVSNHAWIFDFGGDESVQQGEAAKDRSNAAWAVRAGDVRPVPAPATWSLLVAGLVGLGSRVFRRRPGLR